MKHTTTVLLSLVPVVLLAACQPQESSSTAAVVTTESSLAAQVSYGLGFSYAQQLTDVGVALEIDAFSAGVMDAINAAESQLSDEELQLAFETYQTQLQEEAIAEQEALGAENLAKAEAFLTENGQVEGVVTTESGLQYKILTEGNGPVPTIGSLVQVNYEGRLLDGTVFESTYQSGEPVEFMVNQVIQGWIDALLLMPEGSKWQLYIPSDLAYGPDGGRLGPNQLLIFDLELLQANYQAPVTEVPAQ